MTLLLNLDSFRSVFDPRIFPAVHTTTIIITHPVLGRSSQVRFISLVFRSSPATTEYLLRGESKSRTIPEKYSMHFDSNDSRSSFIDPTFELFTIHVE